VSSFQVTANSNFLQKTHGFANSQPTTIWCWFRFNALSGGFQTVWSCDNATSNFMPTLEWDGSALRTTTIATNIGDSLGSAIAGRWYFAAIVMNGTSTPALTYFGADGMNLTTVTAAANFAGFGGTTIVIYNETANDQPMNGQIRDFGIAKRAMSPSEINAVYRRQLDQRPPVGDLWTWLPMIDYLRPGIDQSGARNDWTLTGIMARRVETPAAEELRLVPRLLAFARAALSGGGTNTPMTISVTQAQALTMARQVGLPRSATETQTRSRIVAIARSIVGANTATATAAKALPRSAAVTQVQLGSAAEARGLVRTIVATASQLAGRIVGVGLPRAATQAQAGGRAVGVGVARAGGETQTPTIKSRGIGWVVAAAATQALAMVRNIGRALAITSTATPSAQEVQGGGGTHNVNASATQVQTPTVRRAVARAIAAVAAGTPTAAKALARSVAATAAQAPSRKVGVGAARATGATGSPAMARKVAPAAKQATQAATPSRGIGRYMTLAATVSQAGSATYAHATLFVGQVLSGLAAKLHLSSLAGRLRSSTLTPRATLRSTLTRK
jgi:hypothetical protein